MCAIVCFASLQDCSVLKFLPWERTEFSVRADGIPTLNLFRLVHYFRAFISLSCICAVAASSPTEATSLISLVVSLISLLFYVFILVLRLKAEDIMKFETFTELKSKLPADVLIQNMQSAIEKLQAEKSENEKVMSDRGDEILLLRAEIEKVINEKDTEISSLIKQIGLCRNLNTRLSVDDHNGHRKSLTMKLFTTSTNYAEENLEIVRSQIIKLGHQPVEHIPLAKIRSELTEIMASLNGGYPCDEQRLDHLLLCLEWNKEYTQEEEQKRLDRNATIAPFVSQCSATMCGYVPVNIAQHSESSLRNVGLNAMLARRIFNKKCLWLIRMPPEIISRMHESDLLSRYSPDAQHLDLVELAAVYGALPEKFINDATGRKQEVRIRLENNINSLLEEQSKQSFTSDKFRNRLYNDCPPPFTLELRFMIISNENDERDQIALL